MNYGRYPNYVYSRPERAYGKNPDGTDVFVPDGWVMLPEGAEVPSAHREFTVDHDGWWTWCDPRRCRSTMTPIHASIWGHVVCFAVPAT